MLLAKFECVSDGILKKERHFQLSVFREDSENGLKIAIESILNFDFP